MLTNPVRMHPWTAVFLAGFIVYVTIRGVFDHRTRGEEKVIRHVDAREWILMAVVGIGSILFPLLFVFTAWLAFADYRLPPYAPWCGAVAMVGALWLFWRAHADLGQNWSMTLEMRKGHQMITQGVYRSIRHPMYASIFLFGLAQGLLLENWLAGWSAFATFALMYLGRIPREERMMREFFGQEYRDYAQQTGRLFPRLMTRKVRR